MLLLLLLLFSFLKEKNDCLGIFFSYYILILQTRNYFILIVSYPSTFVEAKKQNASFNFSSDRIFM